MSEWSRMDDELIRMKRGGVAWERAWACVAGANPSRHFYPSEADPGIELLQAPHYIEPWPRFLYRTRREAFLNEGTPLRLTLDEADDAPEFIGMVGSRRAA